MFNVRLVIVLNKPPTSGYSTPAVVAIVRLLCVCSSSTVSSSFPSTVSAAARTSRSAIVQGLMDTARHVIGWPVMA